MKPQSCGDRLLGKVARLLSNTATLYGLLGFQRVKRQKSLWQSKHKYVSILLTNDYKPPVQTSRKFLKPQYSSKICLQKKTWMLYGVNGCLKAAVYLVLVSVSLSSRKKERKRGGNKDFFSD